MGVLAGLLVLALASGSALLGWFVLQQALVGSRYVQWSSVPIVWAGELVLAACCGLLAVGAIYLAERRSRTRSAGGTETFLYIGLGFLAAAAISIVAGWLGLEVPTNAGYDVLERGEPIFIIGGLVVGAFGALLMFVVVLANAAGLGAEDGPAQARPRTLPWTDPNAPTWTIVRSRLLPGAVPGEVVTVAVEEDSVIVAERTELAVERLATYPAGVRLEPAEDGDHRLMYGSDEIAVLRPVDADPAQLAAALDAAGI